MFSIVASETSALTFISTPGLSYGIAPGSGNLGFLQIVAGYIVGRFVVAGVLLPRYFEGNLVTAYALLETAIRARDAPLHVDRVHGDARARRFRARVRDRHSRRADHRSVGDEQGVRDADRGADPRRAHDHLHVQGRHEGGGVDGAAAGRRSTSAAAPPRSSILGHARAGRLVVDLVARRARRERRGCIDFTFTMSNPQTDLGGADRRRVPRHGVARHRSAHRAAIDVVADRSRMRSGRSSAAGFVVFCQFFLFLCIGLGLWAFYHGRVFPITDQIFPTFILEHMPPGLVGLIVAAIVAATMSTHSGAINSLAGATTHDIYLPLTRHVGERRHRRSGWAGCSRSAWGVVLTLGALLFPQDTKTPVVVVALGIASFTYGGLLGGFFLGIFWRRAIQRDAILGMCVAIATMAFIVFAKPIVRRLSVARAHARAVRGDRVALVRPHRHDASRLLVGILVVTYASHARPHRPVRA